MIINGFTIHLFTIIIIHKYFSQLRPKLFLFSGELRQDKGYLKNGGGGIE